MESWSATHRQAQFLSIAMSTTQSCLNRILIDFDWRAPTNIIFHFPGFLATQVALLFTPVNLIKIKLLGHSKLLKLANYYISHPKIPQICYRWPWQRNISAADRLTKFRKMEVLASCWQGEGGRLLQKLISAQFVNYLFSAKPLWTKIEKNPVKTLQTPNF